MSLATKITKKRALRTKLRSERRDLESRLADLIERRRAKAEERRKLVHKRKGKKARLDEVTSDAREEKLRAEIAVLHGQIVDASERLEVLDASQARVRSTLERLGGRIDSLSASIRKLVRKLKRQSGPEAALRRAKKDDGKHEEPPGSNWGGVVEKMIRFTGYNGPVYWCGCAVAWWTLKYGGGSAPNRIRRGYAPFVTADAKARTNGLRVTTSPQKGGWGTLWNGEHIVMTTGRVVNGMVETAEGNTSDTTGGSQSNGDSCSYGKLRNWSDFDCFAAQDYP